MRTMGVAERRLFLAEGTRTGKLGVVRRDGSPLVAPIWFVADGDDLVFTTGADTVKGRSLRRDGRAAVCVDEERPPFAYVRVEGRVELGEDPAALLHWSTRIAARYMGPELAGAYGRRNAVPGELLVRLRPARVRAVAGIAD